MKTVLLIFITFLTTSIGINAQVDFNNYTTILASGPIPNDFSQSTYEKIRARLDSNDVGIKNSINEFKFLDKSMYSIADILTSGYVVFGDPVTNHINQIATQILKDSINLKQRLRFYTLKSDQTNAFSTDEGIIFITTGLISQLNNDAELAYILCHEIVHYIKKHVVNTFIWSQKPSKHLSWISSMSQYSRENEFEADRIAIDLYRAAGFAEDMIESTFDVLLYSYLPFDEIAIDHQYFIPDKMQIPNHLLLDQVYPIKPRENANDAHSTHPNNAKRRAAVIKRISEIQGTWGNSVFIESEEKFHYIRKIARFESLRIQVINNEYASALYSIYILELEDPESAFLRQMKAHCWLGILQFTAKKKKSSVTNSKNHYEGESAAIHHFINEMGDKATIAYAIRIVYDLNASTDDVVINKIYLKVIEEIEKSSLFSLADFKTTANVSSPLAQDTSNLVGQKENLDKYEKIQNARNLNNRESKIDSLNYYQFGLFDVVSDKDFLSYYSSIRANRETQETKSKSMDSLSKREQARFERKHRFDNFRVGVSSFIVMDPTVLCYSSSRQVDNVRSEIYSDVFRNAYTISASEANININIISHEKIDSVNTDAFNHRNALAVQLNQLLTNEDIIPFPIDYEYNQGIIKEYGTSRVLYSVVSHNYSEDLDWVLIGFSIGLGVPAPFFIPAYVTAKVMQANKTNLTILLIDLESGKELIYEHQTYDDPINQFSIAAHLYILFKNMALDITK